MKNNLFDDLDKLLEEDFGDIQISGKYSDNIKEIERYQKNKDKESLGKILEKNSLLVHKIAARYSKYLNHDLSHEDLVSAGNIGLMIAINKFDASKGNQLSTYAVHWIKQSIIREIQNSGHRVRVPVHIIEKIKQAKKIHDNMKTADFIDVNPSSAYSLSENEYQHYIKLYKIFFSAKIDLDKNIGDDNNTSLLEMIDPERGKALFNNPDISNPEKEAMYRILKDDINKILSTIPQKEAEVIELRFGLNGNKAMTLEEIGNMYNVTRERIRQIEAKALRRLRHPERAEPLKLWA